MRLQCVLLQQLNNNDEKMENAQLRLLLRKLFFSS